MKFSIRLLYLYLFSAIGLLITIIGCVRLVDLGMKTFIFPDADKYEYAVPKIEGQTVDAEEQQRISERESQRQRQRELTGSSSMILVGLPVYLYHWVTIKKENNKMSEKS